MIKLFVIAALILAGGLWYAGVFSVEQSDADTVTISLDRDKAADVADQSKDFLEEMKEKTEDILER